MSKVTGTPGWVSDYYTEIVSSSLAKGIHLFQNMHTMHARVIFCRVAGLLETLKVVYILTKGKKSKCNQKETVLVPRIPVSTKC